MAINFTAGNQTLPSEVIQTKEIEITSTGVTGSATQTWHTMFGSGALITAKGSGHILLQTTVNLDVNGGSSGHFIQWEVSTDGSNWSTLGNHDNVSSRVPTHGGLNRKNGTDLTTVTNNITFSCTADETYRFQVKAWLISGANQVCWNRNGTDSNNNSNPRGTSFITATEYV